MQVVDQDQCQGLLLAPSRTRTSLPLICGDSTWTSREGVRTRNSFKTFNFKSLAPRLDYLGLLDLWIKGRPHASAWWNTAREWPSFKSGLRDLISEPEFSEMRIHGPKIANDVAEIIAEIRDSMSEMGSKGDVAPSTEPRN